MLLRKGSEILIARLEVADTLWSRVRGLLGRTELAADRALLIKRCNSIHTFFMKFAIDAVFVDDQLRVRKTFARLNPGRIVFPVWGATSVIEFSAGFLQDHPLTIGEQLHVDHTLS